MKTKFMTVRELRIGDLLIFRCGELIINRQVEKIKVWQPKMDGNDVVSIEYYPGTMTAYKNTSVEIEDRGN